MQIKTTLRKHLTPLRIAIINKSDSKYRRPNQCWRGFTISGGAAIVEISSKISQKVKNKTPYDPSISLLGIHPENSIMLP